MLKKLEELNQYAPLPWEWRGGTQKRNEPCISAVVDADGVLLFGSWIVPQSQPKEVAVHKRLVAFVNEMATLSGITDECSYRAELLDLLAVIHRDGGHRSAEVGLHQALEEAKEIASAKVQHECLQQDNREQLAKVICVACEEDPDQQGDCRGNEYRWQDYLEVVDKVLVSKCLRRLDMQLRVWWIPQVPGKSFYVGVDSVEEGVKVMNILSKYDAFQFEHKIKPDYCNAGGLSVFDPDDTGDGPDGSWVDWYDEETGIDDPREYLKTAR